MRLSVVMLCSLLLGLAGACAPATNRMPEMAFTQLDGSQHRTQALNGKVSLVHFWATTCSICVKEMPQLMALHRRFQAQGLETLAVAMQYDPPAYVMQFAQAKPMPFRVAMDHDGALARAFGGVEATPTTLVFDRRGNLVKRYQGELDMADLSALLTPLLAQPAP